MLGFLIAFVGFLAAAGGIGFLVWHNRQERKKAKQGFRDSLLQALRTTPLSEFRLDEHAKRAKVSPALAQEAAEEIYRQTYSKHARKGDIADNQRRRLTELAGALQIADKARDCIEDQCNQEAYRTHLTQALSGGALSHIECRRLQNLKKSLGVTQQQARASAGADALSWYLDVFRRIARQGPIERQDFRPLGAIQEVLGLSDAEASQAIRQDLLDHYHERFCIAKQDGRITPDEEQELERLQAFLKLSENDVRAYRREIERIKLLDACRHGRLPSVPCTAILEGGEICHYNDACIHRWYTSSGNPKDAQGRLLVTNNRLIFSSDVKNFEVKPSKVMDIEVEGNAVCLSTTGSRGGGVYWVADAELLEAVLYGVVSLHKYIAPDSFSSERSRHIPDDVKRAVWARDGGRCVKCAAREYLEFDHVIPFSKGGSNSERNIQLLCRKCNLRKSDRI